ncbi:hypothetical protein pEaSNUABM42_00265 [Erwinia phage pEa_SNUABM_42]|nr:hypothetical protein pEaSNUABM43_00266 [Erwinia phage pEa_SNUABM_43]QVW55582.1 hypothetical protein pEaSNUABM42_00265 [Erwinia phage pEa_SNUABM_42]
MAKMTSVKDLIADLNAGAKTELVERRLTEESVTNLVRGFEEGTPTIKVTPNEKGEHKLTIADMDTMDQYRANFHEAFGSITKDLIGEEARKDPELGAMEVTLDIGKTTFSTAFARPTGDAPSQKEWAAAIGFGYSTIKNKALEGALRRDFAKGFLEVEEGEDEEDEE